MDDQDISTWPVLNTEVLGTKPRKRWVIAPDGAQWLFKPVTIQRDAKGDFAKGDDWAEKLVAEVAAALAIPSATVELAHVHDELGVISLDVRGDRELVLGNVLLSATNESYQRSKRHGVSGYNLRAIADTFSVLGVKGVTEDENPLGAMADFAHYLALDALVGNLDRHHENWGALIGFSQVGVPELRLSPTFDHASALGYLLPDSQRVERLDSSNDERSVEGYAVRAFSRHFEGRPSLVDLAREGFDLAGPATAVGLLQKLETLDLSSIDAVTNSIPEDRMSHPSRMFATRMLTENRRRLLDALGT